MNLLLFDIDGTLLLSGGAGNRAINRAFLFLFGIPLSTRGCDFSGMTDPVILRSLFFHLQRRKCTSAEMKNMAQTYLMFLKEEIEASPGFRVLPGVIQLLDQLSLQRNVLLGIATGNLKRGARIKLKRAGLLPYFRFGAYGSDSEERSRIVTLGIERAKSLLDSSCDNHVAFVIGDTPLDIQAGKETGALTVAVATGNKPLEELQKHHPTHLFSDFTRPQDFLRILC